MTGAGTQGRPGKLAGLRRTPRRTGGKQARGTEKTDNPLCSPLELSHNPTGSAALNPATSYTRS